MLIRPTIFNFLFVCATQYVYKISIFFLQVYACATQKPSSPVRMVPVYPLVGFVMVLKIAKMEVMKLLIVDLAVVSI